ncbi:MAG: hypothetical protein ABIJ16_12910 [Bacteroidota bacterium]
MKKLVLVLVIVFSANMFLNAQDTILLLNGRIWNGKISRVTADKIFVDCPNRIAFKTKRIFREDIFSLTHKDKTIVYYRKDEDAGYSLSQEQMSFYIKGVTDARRDFHAPLATLGGFASGLTGGCFGFWGAFIPTSFVFACGIKKPELAYNYTMPGVPGEFLAQSNNGGMIFNGSITEAGTNEYFFSCYKEGFEATAKEKKIKNSIKGTVAGFVGCVVLSFFIIK